MDEFFDEDDSADDLTHIRQRVQDAFEEELLKFNEE